MENNPTVVLASSDADAGASLGLLIEQATVARVVDTTEKWEGLIALVRDHEPDLVVLALGGTTDALVSRTGAIADQLPNVGVIVISEHSDPRLAARVIRAGCSAYLTRGAVDAEIADAVVSVVEVPHQYTPESVMQLDEEGMLRSLSAGKGPTRRQDKPKLYARNGPAVLVVRPHVVDERSLYVGRTVPLIMSAEYSIDIDGPHDLLLAEWLLMRKGAAHAGGNPA